MKYRSRIARHLKTHHTYVRQKMKQIPKSLTAAGLAPHLLELLEKHKKRAQFQADAAQRKTPLKDEANAQVQKQQGEKLKQSTEKKFKKTKLDLMASIRGFSKKDLADVKKRKLKDRKKEVTALSQIREFNKKKMKKVTDRKLKPKPKSKPTLLDDIKKGRKLKKVFKKEPNRKDHLRRLREDKAYYAAHYEYRRKRFKKK